MAKRDTIAAAFLISYFVLVGVSTKILQVYQCESFDDGNSYLVADYSINCNSADRGFYLAYASFMIMIYPIGIPLIYAIILIKYRKLINPNWRLVIDGAEKVIVNNKIIQAEKIKVRNTYNEIKDIKNLYDSYTPKRWYFELFECARRLLLGAIPVLLFRGSSLQIIIVLLISLLSVAVFMQYKPYIHGHDNDLAIIAQWSITLVFIAALLIRVEDLGDDGGDATLLGILLIFINISVIVFSVWAAIIHSKAAIKEEEELEKEEQEEAEIEAARKKRLHGDINSDSSSDSDNSSNENSEESVSPYKADLLAMRDDQSIEDDDDWEERTRLSENKQKKRQFKRSKNYNDKLESRGIEIEMNPLHDKKYNRNGDSNKQERPSDWDSDDEYEGSDDSGNGPTENERDPKPVNKFI